MRKEDKTSREIYLESLIKYSGYYYQNIGKCPEPVFKRELIAIRQEAACAVFEKIVEEYKKKEKPRFVLDIESRIQENKELYEYHYEMIKVIYNYLVEGKNEHKILRGLVDDVAPSMFMEKLLKFMKKDEMIKRLEVLGKNFNVRDAAELKREYEQKIQELENREKDLNVSISSKIHEITALEERKATISDEVNSIIEAELKEKRADLDIQLNQALIEQRIIEHSKLKEELEAEKQKCLENMESSCKYTLRRKEIQELMDATEVLQEQKELVRQDIRKEIDAVKKLFKKQQEEMEEKIRQLSVDMEKSYMDATNRLVLQGRKLQQEDAKKFLNICCELQSLIYYGISEEELGVPPKKIESYLSRFMRDLKSVGYESEMPEIGEAFDAYKHEDVEPRDGEVEDVDLEEAVVKEVVSCAFKTTEDGVEDYVKKAKVVVGRKV